MAKSTQSAPSGHSEQIAAAGPRSEAAFSAAVVLGFLLVGGVTMFYHEMWRDELQTWMTVTGSHSFSELLANKRYDGHPILWYLLPYVASKFTGSFVSMQVIHLLIAAGTAWLIASFAPFTRFKRALLAFGYFPLYEYGVITRNYAIGIFLLLLFLSLYDPRRRPGWVLPLILAVAAQANAMSLILAVWLGGFYYAAFFLTRKGRPAASRQELAGFVAGVVILIAGAIISAAQLAPPPGSWAGPLRLNVNVRVAELSVGTLWCSYVPIPSSIAHFWNTNIVVWPEWQAVLSAGLLILFLLAFVRRPLIAISYVAVTLGLFLFFYTRYFGFMRHHGHVYLMLVICMWLYDLCPEYKPANRLLAGITSVTRKASVWCFGLLLFVQAGAGLFACVTDWVYPFSASKEVAEYLVKEKLAEKPIAGCLDYVASAAGARLGRPIYFPQNGRTGTFLIFDGQREESLRRLGASPEFLNLVLGNSYRYMMSQKQDILLMLSFSLGKTPPMIVPIKEFRESVQPDEIYFLYWMKYPGPSQ